MGCDDFDGKDCCLCKQSTLTVVMEKRCEYRFITKENKRICKIHIDGCLIKSGVRCDYLLIDCSRNKAYFVELKGSDFLHAVNQLGRSIDYLAKEIGDCDVFARIVLTKVNVPNLINNPTLLRFEKMLKKRGGNLRAETVRMVENISW